jgi:hypothetical protein
MSNGIKFFTCKRFHTESCPYIYTDTMIKAKAFTIFQGSGASTPSIEDLKEFEKLCHNCSEFIPQPM